MLEANDPRPKRLALLPALWRALLRIFATFVSHQLGRSPGLIYVVIVWGAALGWLHYEFWWEMLPMEQWVMLYSLFAASLAWTGFRMFILRFTDVFEV